jgi:AcrR family transcriptional regulator
MKKGERRKQELLKIAYRMFTEKGYENTSIDEIIAEAGIAKGTYYYYFPSKEQMLEDVIDSMIERIIPLLAEVVEEGVSESIFECDKIAERVKMLLILSDGTFNEGTFGDFSFTPSIRSLERH